jgi:hypothetical protein
VSRLIALLTDMPDHPTRVERCLVGGLLLCLVVLASLR